MTEDDLNKRQADLFYALFEHVLSENSSDQEKKDAITFVANFARSCSESEREIALDLIKQIASKASEKLEIGI